MPDDRPTAHPHRIVALDLDQRTIRRWSPEVDHERKVAIYDLLEDNRFEPVGCEAGPYRVVLSIEDNRLVFDIRDADDRPLGRVPLPVRGFRRIVKEYFLICESYYEAIRSAAPSKIEAIDMGRRGVHNEGSVMLQDALAGKIAIDHQTARRFFTLLCVLHIRG